MPERARAVSSCISCASCVRPIVCAFLMFGTMSPRGVAAAIPRLTYFLTTMSSPSSVELIRGFRATAQATAFATMSSGDTRTSSPRTFDALRRRTNAIVSVTSTSRNSVTCGIVNAESTIALAIIFTTPLNGIRSSRASASTLAEAVGPAAVAPVAAGAAVPSAAACTSARVTSPRDPVGVTDARSMPRSFASLRTGGLASGLPAEAVSADAAAPSDAAGPASGCAGAGAAGAEDCAVPEVSAALDCDGATDPPLRGRRFDEAALAPYPTRVAPPSSSLVTAPSESGAVASACGALIVSAPAPAPSAPPKRMIGVPTSTVCPSSTRRAPTVPACGLGSSTRDFAVSISTRIWLTVTSSPGATFQDTMSASVRPSPTSGRGNSNAILASFRQ